MKAEHIQSDPAVMMGKPVIAGTRITVELILEKLAAGESIEQILDAHPRLTREVIVEVVEMDAERESWMRLSIEQLSCAYADDELEYELNALKDENPNYEGRRP